MKLCKMTWEEHMFLVKLFTSVLAAFLITFGYFDVWGEKLNKNAAPLGAMFISLWVVLTIAICVLSVAIGGISANVYSQEQLDEARQEAYAAGVRDGADEQKEAYSELFYRAVDDLSEYLYDPDDFADEVRHGKSRESIIEDYRWTFDGLRSVLETLKP